MREELGSKRIHGLLDHDSRGQTAQFLVMGRCSGLAHYPRHQMLHQEAMDGKAVLPSRDELTDHPAAANFHLFDYLVRTLVWRAERVLLASDYRLVIAVS